MSDKDRKKKDGQRADKKRQRMRESVKERHEQAGPERPSRDQADLQKFKPGSASDRTWQRGMEGEPPGREVGPRR
jgi:hypothetical protein